MKKNRLIIILASFVIGIALLVSLFFDSSITNQIIEIITVGTAIIGAIALFIQFKKDKDLNQANFVMEFSKTFFNEYNCGDLFTNLDTSYENTKCKWKLDFERDREAIVRYFLWIESLSAVIMDNVLDIRNIDKALEYRFFILVNNKIVQNEELIHYRELYIGTYKLYDIWYKYRKKHNLPIPLEKDSLHLTEGYDEIIQK